MSNVGGVRCYPYDSVYPLPGQELQLEQLRALLPVYGYTASSLPSTTVVHYQKDQVYPSDNKEFQLEQVRASLPRYEVSYDMEMTICTTTHWPASHGFVNKENERPLCITVDMEEENSESELKPSSPNPASATKCDAEEKLRQLELEVLAPSSLSLLQDKENRNCAAFTPDTVDGSLQWPCTNRAGGRINTKLNFTDTDSNLSTSSHTYLAEDIKQHSSIGSQLAKFGVSSDQAKAKLLHCQEEWKAEFAMTEVETHVGHVHTSESPEKRKPLQTLPSQKLSFCHYSANMSCEATKDESSFLPYHDSFHTVNRTSECAAAKSGPSFSIYEDSNNESSFMPYHDSVCGDLSSQNPQANPSIPVHGVPSITAENCEQAYSVPLGVPLGHCTFSEQTFTQIDIGHPKQFDPVSTPKFVHSQKDLSTLDISVISDYKAVPISAPLSPIKEESSKSTSSRFTVSSSSHSGSSSVGSVDYVNPFLPDTVKRMLNNLGGVPQHAVQLIPPPPMVSLQPGNQLLLGETSMDILDKGNFSGIYKVQKNAEIQALRVHNYSMEWEITIIHQLQQRLQHSSLPLLEYHQIFRCPSAFYSLSMHYPLGSLQDVVRIFSGMKRVVPEALAAYLGLEMLTVVKYLHQCGIIHASIKPSHFLVHDIRQLLLPHGVRPGALRLVGMRHAIDTRQFPETQLFVGDVPYLTANNVMLERQPWKWQVDYCALALCLLALITPGQPPMVIKKDHLYTWANKPYKKFNSPVWQNLIETLLNTEDFLAQSNLDWQMLQERANFLKLPDIKVLVDHVP